MKKNTPPTKNWSLIFYVSIVFVACFAFFMGIQYANKASRFTYTIPKIERSIIKEANIQNNNLILNQNDLLIEPENSNINKLDEKELANQKEVKLFYVVPQENGLFSLKSTQTKIAYDGKQELTATINALLNNPKIDNKNYYNMIPEGSKLLSANVKEGIAYLNFNDAFRYNSFGIDGYKAQLNQVVYTATEFSTVKQVKFLIEGQDVHFLHEGIDISKPLYR